MNINKINKHGKQSLALSQILLLLIGIFAFSYAIGSEMGEVGKENKK